MKLLIFKRYQLPLMGNFLHVGHFLPKLELMLKHQKIGTV